MEDKRPDVRINVNRSSWRRWEVNLETDVFAKREKEETYEKEAYLSCRNKYDPHRTA